MRELPDSIDSRFRYVLIASKRAEQLIQGSAPKIRSRHAKPTRMAMEELEEGLVNWMPTAPEPDELEVNPLDNLES